MTDTDADIMEAKLARRGRGWRRLRGLLLAVLLILSIVFLVRWLLFATVFVPDTLMAPTIEQESRLLCLKLGGDEPGDLALVHTDRGFMIRRVIAGPGSTVQQTREGLSVDGELLPRQEVGTHTYVERHLESIAGGEHICDEWREEIAGRSVRVCVSRRSEHAGEPIELGPDDYYVRCDNRALCAQREISEGVVPGERIAGRVLFLMGTRDDSDQPFYKRWFGRFERVR